jgi:surface antigen
MRTRTVTALLLACSLAAPLPAFADPPEWAGVWRHEHGHHRHHDDDDDDVRVIYAAPPPVVVYQQAPPQQVAQIPYGLARGTCDRAAISSELMGGVIGGATGGLLGSRVGRGSGRTAATIGGALIGVIAGSAVGRGMDQADEGCAQAALSYLPDQRAVAWQSDEGDQYRMVPVKSYREDGRQCREYQATATIGGKRRQTYGTACRQPDGSWQIMD